MTTTHPDNPTGSAVVTNLHLLGLALGHDYPTALVAAHQTAKEIDSFDAAELADRCLARCRATAMTNHLMTLTNRSTR